jgi:hypothetical protein
LNKWLKIIIIVFGLVLVSIVSYYLYLNSYVPYVPMDYSEQRCFFENSKLNTPEYQENIEIVFRTHDVPWKMKNGKIMIPRKMKIGFTNRELLNNFTLWANDPQVINNLKKQEKELRLYLQNKKSRNK